MAWRLTACDDDSWRTGKLALTLIGVAQDSVSGECRFLILDPHYTGVDDLIAVQSKEVTLEGYRAKPCAWRGLEAFEGKESYRLCLPLCAPEI